MYTKAKQSFFHLPDDKRPLFFLSKVFAFRMSDVFFFFFFFFYKIDKNCPQEKRNVCVILYLIHFGFD